MDIRVEKLDDVHLKIYCDRGIGMEISERFKFQVNNARFNPKVKNGVWDGFIRLYNQVKGTMYVGLLPELREFAKTMDYSIQVSDEFDLVDVPNNVLLEELSDGMNPKFEIRDYQLRAISYAIRNNRALIVSPTSSGKSLIIYCLLKYYLKRVSGKALVIVPTTSLVGQLTEDFKDYTDSSKPQFYYTHQIVSGKEKYSENRIYVSTWQSIYNLPKEFLDQFDVIIGDEAHLFAAKSLVGLLEKATGVKHKFALTGSLDQTQVNEMVLRGLFGPLCQFITTKELMDQNVIAKLGIKCITLKYPESQRKIMYDLAKKYAKDKKKLYYEEVQFLINNQSRNNFIKNLALTRTGNTLVLFQFTEKHGKILYDMIKAGAGDRKVFYIDGKVSGDERNRIIQIVEKETDAIIIASNGTFSTGINLKNLHNLIFIFGKSIVKVVQSIGRILRKSETKNSAKMYDISDDMSQGSYKPFSLSHRDERIQIYNKEQHDYKMYDIQVK